MARKKDRRKHIVIGKDFRSDGKERLTKGEDYLVHGGTALTHDQTVDIVDAFSRRLRKEGNPDASTAEQILKEVLYERRQRN